MIKTVAFIPVRGGSKSIPLKNIKKIAGYPLIYWTAKAVSECEIIDRCFIATDSEIIKETIDRLQIPGIEVIGRSEKSASDTASTEAAMLEFAENYIFEDIVLVQATNPLLTASDLKKGLELYHSNGIDSVLSVVEQKRFVWKKTDTGTAVPVNYDFFRRPRRQEFNGFYVENGAFYVTSRKALLETKCRLSGNIGMYVMPEDTYYEIDEPDDWIVIEELLRNRNRETSSFDLSKIKMVLTDCDGVLTDGGMYYSENGDELKKFNTRDGVGLRMLKDRGIITGIITGEDRELNRRRAFKLEVNEMCSGVKEKTEEIRRLLNKYHLSSEQVVYIGDDLNDLETIKMVGFGCCPADADERVKCVARYITKCRGGQGVVREISDLLLGSVQ